MRFLISFFPVALSRVNAQTSKQKTGRTPEPFLFFGLYNIWCWFILTNFLMLSCVPFLGHMEKTFNKSYLKLFTFK